MTDKKLSKEEFRAKAQDLGRELFAVLCNRDLDLFLALEDILTVHRAVCTQLPPDALFPAGIALGSYGSELMNAAVSGQGLNVSKTDLH